MNIGTQTFEVSRTFTSPKGDKVGLAVKAGMFESVLNFPAGHKMAKLGIGSTITSSWMLATRAYKKDDKWVRVTELVPTSKVTVEVGEVTAQVVTKADPFGDIEEKSSL